ncbi:MAG TPA: hypothetical protein VLC98_12535, partial [Phnomibacter sp.]|nr:hypothetical protein [Phnomibacter sp.]
MTVEVDNNQENSNEISSADSDFQFVEDEHVEEESEVTEETETKSNTDEKETDAEEDELELFLGDESQSASSAEDEKNPELVKNLRKEIQARNKRIAELEAGTNTKTAVDINEKLVLPTLESANYDEDNYQKALITYFDKKAAQEKAKLEAEEQNKQFQA